MFENLCEVIKNTASNENALNKLGFLDEQYIAKEITYDWLYKKVIDFTNCLNANNIKKGDKLLLNVIEPYKYIISFWGAVMGGIIPVVLPYDKNVSVMGQFDELVKGIQKNWGKLPTIVEEMCDNKDDYDQVIVFDDIEKGICDIKECCSLDIDGDDTAVIYFSSGSSGTPKGIPLTHKQMIRQIEAINKRLNITCNDKIFNWLPLTHIFGFTHFHLSAVFSGANQTHMTAQTFITSPEKYADYLSNHNITITGGMNISTKLLADVLEYEATYDLSELKHYILCGEPTNVNYVNEFITVAKRYRLKQSAVKTAYAMTETGCVISIEDDFLLIENTENGGKIVSQGKPYDCIEVVIMDDCANVVSGNTPGEVCVKGDVVFSGYCNSSLNESNFVNGFFKTGDIGYFSDGRLFISGRKKDIIIINGLNYFPVDIDNAIYENLKIKTVAMQLMSNDSGTKELLFFETKNNDCL